MEWVAGFVTAVYKYLEYRDDTSVDRLNRLYTVAILSACVTLITSQQSMVGGRIACWTPQDFTSAHVTYAQNICWLGHTNYYVSQNRTILESPSSPRPHAFPIYPWLPIVLTTMTVGFAAPYLLIWRGLSARSGMNIGRLMKLDKPERLMLAVDDVLQRKYLLSRGAGVYVTAVYLTMRIVYVLNLLGQIVLVNKLLTGRYFHVDVAHLVEILSVKYNMWASAHLPIETMCDFMVRMLGDQTNWYTIQCILPFNLFTKRILAFLLLWFGILLVINVIDLAVNWLWRRIYLHSHRHDYIFRLIRLYQSYLSTGNASDAIPAAGIRSLYRNEFVYGYLGLDGYLLLKTLHATSTEVNMSKLVAGLYRRFLERRCPRTETDLTKPTSIVL